MPRRNGSYFGLTVNPTPTAASGIWRVREAEEYLRVNKWPATPGVPGSPVGTVGDAQVSLTWSAPSLGSPPTDYQVQYSSDSGATWTTFADGTSTATSAVVTGLTNGTGYIFRVRAVNALGEGPYGAASGTVTPASLLALLLHFDGANGSTTFTDSSLNALTVTAYGDAQISTAQGKFGGASGYFDAAGSYLEIANAASLELGGGDFCIELWFYHDGNSSMFAGLVGKGGVSSTTSDVWSLELGGEGIIFVPWVDTGAAVTCAEPARNQWNHVAATRSGDTLRLFVNGVQGAVGNLSASIPEAAAPLVIGAGWFDPAGRGFSGYIEELRIIKGAAVYTENFTPPTAPF